MSSESTAVLGSDFVPPDEDSFRGDSDSNPESEYRRLLERLCNAAVTRRFEAFRDIDWDDPEMLIDPDDPRWELDDDHPLGQTDWYRSQPPETRARIGLNMIAGFMYTGRVFEGVLSRGLLRFAATQPHNSLEYRFAYHEVIEESHHSLMFQEFVNRAGLPVPTIDAGFIEATESIAAYGTTFPELLFIYALGGEDPIDYVQRESYKRKTDRHPLTQRISQIHIIEEARHVSFARAFLRLNVPRLDEAKRDEMALTTPTILGVMAAMMTQAPDHIITTYSIPPEVITEAFIANPAYRDQVVASLAKIRMLCEDLGLMTSQARAIWEQAGLTPL